MSKTQMDPRDNLPLTPQLFHVLLALAGGELHGYAILKDIADRTEGQLQLGPGTLYGIIKRLLQDGWIEETDSPGGADSRRRYYRLTADGRKIALAEAQRLESLVSSARSRRLLRPVKA